MTGDSEEWARKGRCRARCLSEAEVDVGPEREDSFRMGKCKDWSPPCGRIWGGRPGNQHRKAIFAGLKRNSPMGRRSGGALQPPNKSGANPTVFVNPSNRANGLRSGCEAPAERRLRREAPDREPRPRATPQKAPRDPSRYPIARLSTVFSEHSQTSIDFKADKAKYTCKIFRFVLFSKLIFRIENIGNFDCEIHQSRSIARPG